MPLSETLFRKQVLQRSDIIVSATISDFSHAPDNIQPKWTKVKIIRAYKGKPPAAITIEGWQANDMPLFGYHPGDSLLLFLKPSGVAYALTQAEWKDCVPSIMELSGDGTVYPNFTVANPDLDHKRIAIDKLTSYLLSAKPH